MLFITLASGCFTISSIFFSVFASSCYQFESNDILSDFQLDFQLNGDLITFSEPWEKSYAIEAVREDDILDDIRKLRHDHFCSCFQVQRKMQQKLCSLTVTRLKMNEKHNSFNFSLNIKKILQIYYNVFQYIILVKCLLSLYRWYCLDDSDSRYHYDNW